MTIKRIHNENEIPQPKNPGPHSFLPQSCYSFSCEVLVCYLLGLSSSSGGLDLSGASSLILSLSLAARFFWFSSWPSAASTCSLCNLNGSFPTSLFTCDNCVQDYSQTRLWHPHLVHPVCLTDQGVGGHTFMLSCICLEHPEDEEMLEHSCSGGRIRAILFDNFLGAEVALRLLVLGKDVNCLLQRHLALADYSLASVRHVLSKI